MAVQISKTIFNNIAKLVSDSEESVSRLDALIRKKDCNIHNLSFNLADVSEAHGAAGVLVRMFPDDSEVNQLWHRAANVHDSGYRLRDKFADQCICRNKSK